MRKLAIALSAIALAVLPVKAQNLNEGADNIVGTYFTSHGGEDSRIAVTKASDGTYQAQVIWCNNDHDASGKKYTDIKNPDKSLRNTPCDQIVLVKGLKYNASKKVWNDAKIYDPTRGIKANVTIKFLEDGRLSVRGQVLGIGETVYWKKIK